LNDLLPPDDSAPHQRRASIGASIRAVLWSFFGVRSSRGQDEDMRSLNPAVVILTGVAVAALFVIVLLLIVRWVVAGAVPN
jgi:ABC-type Fe3+-siderophore transport system permease subunit